MLCKLQNSFFSPRKKYKQEFYTFKFNNIIYIILLFIILMYINIKFYLVILLILEEEYSY